MTKRSETRDFNRHGGADFGSMGRGSCPSASRRDNFPPRECDASPLPYGGSDRHEIPKIYFEKHSGRSFEKQNFSLGNIARR